MKKLTRKQRQRKIEKLLCAAVLEIHLLEEVNTSIARLTAVRVLAQMSVWDVGYKTTVEMFSHKFLLNGLQK